MHCRFIQQFLWRIVCDCIFQGSAAIKYKVKWEIQLCVCGQIICACNSERIIKIGQYLRKLCSNKKGSSFWLTVYSFFWLHDGENVQLPRCFLIRRTARPTTKAQCTAGNWTELFRRPSPVLDCQEPATAVAGRRSSSPVQYTAENWTELNWTIQFSSVQLSSVQFSAVHWAYGAPCIAIISRASEVDEQEAVTMQ